MITIIDHGSGNLFAIGNILKNLKVEFKISNKIEDIINSDKYILPGVGSFDTTMNNLNNSNIIDVLSNEVFTNKTSKGNAEKNAHVAKSTVPLGRVADPMEVARLALFLSSEMSSYSTGSEFVVDGGNMGAAM